MPDTPLRDCIQKIATGPEYSRDLDRGEARDAALAILDGRADPVQAAIFFIALRMKRESDAENAGVLDALRQHCRETAVAVDELIDVADPYDGHSRGLPVVTFLPALLAACGLPAASHGVESVGPKHGASQRQVLRAAGAPFDLDPAAAAAQIADPAVGWAYLDQRHACPALHALLALREAMVKRPVLTTLETLLGPLRARRATHLYTGYVHAAYPRKYALLAQAAGFTSALIVRGVEGGVIPSLQQPAKAWRIDADEAIETLRDSALDPAELGIAQGSRGVPLPDGLGAGEPRAADFQSRAAAACVEAGLAALQGASGAARDALVYAAALALRHCRRAESLPAAAALARAALDDGRALRHFRAAG